MAANTLDVAILAIRSGRFRDAVEHLEALKIAPGEQSYELKQALLADALQLTGHNSLAARLATHLVKRKGRNSSAIARCHIVLGNIARDRRDVGSFLEEFQKAVRYADDGADLELACWAKLRLMLAVAEQQGTEAAVGMLPDVRVYVNRFGDPAAVATLHLCLAKLEGTRGLLSSARRHIGISRALLSKHPNVWIEGNADIDDACIAFLASDVDSAFLHATNALKATNISGHAATRRAACANLGHVHLTRGEFEKARIYFLESLSLCQPGGGSEIAILDGLAQLELAEGNYEACNEFLTTIERLENTRADQLTYYQSWAFRTRLQLLIKLGRSDDATALIRHLKPCWAAFPSALTVNLLLLDAELMAASGNIDEAQRAVNTACTTFDGSSLEILGGIERGLSNTLKLSGRPEAAVSHSDRALKIFTVVGNIAAKNELLAESSQIQQRATATRDRSSELLLERIQSSLQFLQYPELLGREIFAIFDEMGCTTYVSLVVKQGRVYEQLALASNHHTREGKEEEELSNLNLGTARDNEFIVTFRPQADLQSKLSCKAIAKVVETALELQRLRREANERQAIWPSDEQSAPGDVVFVCRPMVDILKTIRKIGHSNVSVLLTGETGTGKEVIARTLHNCSNRTSKPFIPFNCAAVPRDLVESQLFGHRRGAFSGAHDHFEGVIRGARGGTLFLDEIGELSMEVQPKLLRFLESGEIHPLGEAKPLHVDVRIVAATNANLERLVSNHQFREDLFYRLNVIRFIIPTLRERREEIPVLVMHFLRRSAEEQHKTGLTIADDTMEYLLLYEWPGNVRQLSNEVKRIVALADEGATIRPEHLSPEIRGSRKIGSTTVPSTNEEIIVKLDQSLGAAVQHVERTMLLHALKKSNGRVETAAKALGLSRKGLYLKRQRLNLGSDM